LQGLYIERYDVTQSGSRPDVHCSAYNARMLNKSPNVYNIQGLVRSRLASGLGICLVIVMT